jgi:hypothetical protein
VLVRWVLAFTLAVSAASCGSTSVSQLTGPGAVDCSVTAATPQQALASNGDRVSLTITAARDCLWSANANAPWLQVTPAEGQGAGAVVATAASNPGSDPRIATVSINGTSVTIVQTGTQPVAPVPPASETPVADPPDPTVPPAQPPVTTPNPPSPPPTCTPSVSPTSVTVDSKGGPGRIVVTVAAGCAWSAVSNAGWVTITSGRNGTGNGEVAYSVQDQKGKGSRSTTLSIAGITVAVSQSGK